MAFFRTRKSPRPRPRPPFRRLFVEPLEERILMSGDGPRYVTAMYPDLLGRPADAGGLAGWGALLDQGLPPAQVVQGIENSPEYRAVRVEGLYQGLLGRPADPVGMGNLSALLAQGGSLQRARALLMGSPEYLQNRGGGSGPGYLAALFHDALGRPISPGEQASWGQLLGFFSRTVVAELVLSSPEAEQHVVAGYYAQLLHRAPDPAGLAGFGAFLQQGVQVPLTKQLFLSDGDPSYDPVISDGRESLVVAALAGSPEYAARVPPAPGPGPTPESCAFASLDGWTVQEAGGSAAGHGTVAAQDCQAVLREGDSFTVTLSRTFTVPQQPSVLSFTFDGPSFDTTAPNAIKDAFEASLVAGDPQPLVHTFRPDRDAFFNVSEGQAPALGAGTTLRGNQVTTDLSGLAPGSQATIVFRLVNNDGDTNTTVRLDDFEVVAGGRGTPVSAVPAVEPAPVRRPIDFSLLADVSASFQAEYTQTSFDEDTHVLHADLAVRDAGRYGADAPLVVAVNHLSDPSVRVVNADGMTPDGLPYFDYSGLAGGGSLAPGAATGSRTLAFFNANKVPFTYDLVVLAALNQPPAFTSQPNTEGIPGVPYAYQAAANDADHDPLTYALVAAPKGMAVDAATGKVTWSPQAGDVGTQSVVLRVADARGGSATQQYTVTVGKDVPNRPPVFDSTSVAQAYVNTPYSYQAAATDPDGDRLTYALVSGPAGMTVDPHTGLVRWTPKAGQRGTASADGPLPVRLSVDDHRGGTAQQSFNVCVLPQPGDYPPVIVSTPVKTADASSPYRYQVRALDADHDPLTYSLTQAPVGMTIDPATGLISWSPTAGGVLSLVGQVAASGGTDEAVAVYPNGGRTLAYVPGTQTIDVVDVSDPTTPLVVSTFGQKDLVQGGGARVKVSGDLLLVASQYSGYNAASFQFLVYSLTNPLAPRLLSNSGYTIPYLFGLDVQGKDAYFTSGGGYFTWGGGLFATFGNFSAVDFRDPAKPFLASRLSDNDSASPPVGQTQEEDVAAVNGQVAYVASSTATGGPGAGGTTTGVGRLLVVNTQDPTKLQEYPLPDGKAGGKTELDVPGTVYLYGIALEGSHALVAGSTKGLNRDGGNPGNVTLTVLDVSDPLNPGIVTTVTSPNTISSTVKVQDLGNNQFAVTGTSLNGNPVLEFVDIRDPADPKVTNISVPATLNGGITAANGKLYVTSTSGLEILTYQPDGSGTVTVRVDDGRGGFDTQTFPVTVSRPVSVTVPASSDPWLAGMPSGSAASIRDTAPAQSPLLVSGLTLSPGEILEFPSVTGKAATSASVSLVGPNGYADFANHLTLFGWPPLPDRGAENGISGLTAPFASLAGVFLGADRPDQTAAPAFLDFSPSGNVPGGVNYQTLSPRLKQVFFIGDGKTSQGQLRQVTVPPGATRLYLGIVDNVDWTDDTGSYQVTVQPVNLPGTTVRVSSPTPVFTNSPPPGATVGQAFRYYPTATGNGLTFDLPAAPTGMAVDPGDGTLAWMPTPDEVGPNTVVLRATDNQGHTALQSFQVMVGQPDAPPVITSAAPATAYVSVPFRYRVHAADAEGDAITYGLVAPPAGMAIDPSTGVLTWTPAAAGRQAVQVTATDAHGGTDSQAFTLQVGATPPPTPPAITSRPRAEVRLDRTYLYEVQATDPNNEPLTYRLTTAPAGMTVDANGVIRWAPTAAQFGSNPVELVVQDAEGLATPQDFTVDVVSQDVNHPPDITSAPPPAATSGDRFEYNAQATDPDGDPVLWSLVKGPAGMSIDPGTGAVRWTPTDDQIGTADVTIQAHDPLWAAATQSFTLTVRCTNLPPAIGSAPPTQAAVGTPYSYQPQATDPDGDRLTYALAAGPPGMTIDRATGLVRWDPVGPAGPVTVSIGVDDGQGNGATQTYTLQVATAPINQPPRITTAPPTSAAKGLSYVYRVAATDPDGDKVTFALPKDQAPAGMSIDAATGMITWQPAADQVGDNVVTVTATDPGGAAASQTFTVNVEPGNQPPVITSTPPAKPLFSGQTYGYDVQATDPDGDPLSYSLPTAPAGMTIDNLGRLLWPTGAVFGQAPVTVAVTDSHGAATQQTFTVTVQPDAEAPRVSVAVSPNPAHFGDAVQFTVTATDNVQVRSLNLTVNGTPLALAADGTALMTATTLGTLPVVATATDPAGNTGTFTTSLVVRAVSIPGVGPTVQDLSPGDQATVTAPTPIKGTVTDPHLVSYQVQYAPFDQVDLTDLANSPGSWVTIGQGTQPVTNGVLATFDPTMVMDDAYVVRVLALNSLGQVTAQGITLNVAGNLKLGQFTQSFTDLSIPVNGIPITVTRVYDTRQSGTSGDFGYGWNLQAVSAQIHATVPPTPPGTLFALFFQHPFQDGTRVYLTNPAGRREGFTFKPNLGPESTDPANPIASYFPPIYHPAFVPDPGVTDQLADTNADTTYLSRSGKNWVWFLFGAPYQPGGYTLTTREGDRYNYSADGTLQSAGDPNGNTLTFTPAGITSSTGPGVVFKRDAQGRIAEIDDPAGHALKYAYDAGGNLVSFTDQTGLTSTYSYLASPAHYLNQWTDPNGHAAVRVAYDGQGRVQSMTDALGNPVTQSYDVANNTETITDALGNPISLTYDNQGNVVSLKDPLGNTTTYQYDANNNQTAVTDPRGFTTKTAYDSRANPIRVTDPLGDTWTATFNQFNKITSVTDPLGRTQTSLFDASGNQTQLINAAGVSSYLAYDKYGRVVSSTDTAGNITAYGYQGLDPNPSKVTNPDGTSRTMQYDEFGNMIQLIDERGNETDTLYDDSGRKLGQRDALGGITLYRYTATLLTSETDPLGHTTYYAYDANNRRTTVTDALGGVEQFVYDANGQQVREIDPTGDVTTTRYRADGKVASVTDPTGDTTTFGYDAAGNKTQITDGNGNTRIYAYDGFNRLIKETDALGGVYTTRYDAVSNPISRTDPLGHTTTYAYDALNRLVKTTDPLGGVTSYAYDNPGHLIAETNADGATTRYGYDSMGRKVRQTDASGGVTMYGYDGTGNLTSTTDPLDNTTTKTYDALNRLVKTVDPLGGVTTKSYDAAGDMTASTDQRGDTTTYAYDALNRLVKTTDPLGGTTVKSYDTDGHVIASTDPLAHTTRYTYVDDQLVQTTDALGGTTTLTYDGNGNVLTSTDALGRTTGYAYDALNRLVKTTDPLGGVTSQTYDANWNVTSTTDPLGHTTGYTYDALGRLIATTDPLGNTTLQAYDAVGNLTSSTDALGNTTTYAYDALNRRTGTTDALSETTTSVYDADGHLLSTTDPLGHTTSYAYDALGRPTTTTDPRGGTTTDAYDAAGNLASSTDQLGKMTTYAYDALNRQTATTDVLGHTTGSTYDAAGNLLTTTDPLGRTTSYTYDALNRQASITDPAGDVTKYGYDAVGNQTSMTDPLNGTTTFTFDGLNRLTKETDPLGHSATRTYDAADNLLSATDRDGRTRAFTYDAANRLTQEAWQQNGATVVTNSYTYDANGNLLTAGNAGSRNTYTYDALNRVATADTTLYNNGTPLPDVKLSYGYDTAGNVRQVSDNQGTTVSSGYDANNRLTGLTWSTPGNQARVDFGYDAKGQVTTQTRYADRAGTRQVGQTSTTYDAVGQVTAITQRGASGAVLAGYGYTWDAAGQLTHETDNGQGTDYTYDRTGQLTSARPSGQGAQTYSYDANGNRTNSGFTTGPDNEVLSDGTYNYTYDNDGNLITRTDIATGATTQYTYDFLNHLTGVVERDGGGKVLHQVQYLYDVFGRRTGQVVDGATTFTVYRQDGTPQPVGAGGAAVNTDAAWADYGTNGTAVAGYLTGPAVDQVLARWQPGMGVSWYLTDHLGSVRAVTGNSGALTDQVDYDSFGNITRETNPAAGDRFKFAGREYDPTTGLYYFRARTYDPSLGRFINQDPLGFAAGDTNLYRYAANRPLSAVDPTGTRCGTVDCSPKTQRAVSGSAAEYFGTIVAVLTVAEAVLLSAGAVHIPLYCNGKVVGETTGIGLGAGLLAQVAAAGNHVALAIDLLNVAANTNQLHRPIKIETKSAGEDVTTTYDPCGGAEKEKDCKCTPKGPSYPGGTVFYDRPTGVSAVLNSSNVPPAGAPHKGFNSNGPYWWHWLEGRYQKGHVLASVLGGPGGSAWYNMVPLDPETNQEMSDEEEAVARLARQPNACVTYTVQVNYGTKRFVPGDNYASAESRIPIWVSIDAVDKCSGIRIHGFHINKQYL